MKRKLLFGIALTTATLFLQPANLALAQAPGSGGGGAAPSGQQGPSTPPTVPGEGGPSLDGGAANAGPSKVDDKKFVKDAAQGGMVEVELGKLATQKGSSDSVKQFGQKMVDDHSKANEELKQVASKGNIAIPDAIDSKHQSRIDKLSKLSGESFDKAYVKDQLKDHQSDVKDFQAEAQGGTDPNVKAFAAKTLPTLQEHLSMVKDLNKSKSSDKASKSN